MVKSNDDMMEVEEDDLEFELVRGLSPDMSAAEHVYFDADSPTSEPIIYEHEGHTGIPGVWTQAQ